MSSKTPSILLVDDDEAGRYATSKVLERGGFEVTQASDYVRALAIIQSDAPIDLLLTDIVMPEGVHGFALARMARMRRMGMKVLYMTGFDVPTVEAIGKVLRKPIADEELIREIREALELQA
jgi:CheY-like chemotaxis protein